MAKYKTEAEYNRQIIDAFKSSDAPEILIVVLLIPLMIVGGRDDDLAGHMAMSYSSSQACGPVASLAWRNFLHCGQGFRPQPQRRRWPTW